MNNDSNYNMRIEQQVLSTILFDFERMEKYIKILKVETFEYKIHANIYKAILSIKKKNLPIDDDFIKKEMEEKKEWNEGKYLEILASNPIVNAKQYILEMQKKHIARETWNIGIELQKGEITLKQLTGRIAKIEKLYKNENDKKDDRNEIELDKLSPFLKNVIADLEQINHHPISMILSTVLTSMAGLIGARANVYNGMFAVYPVVWSIIVAPSSLATKSTLTRYTKKCIFGDLQDKLFEDYKTELEKYKNEKISFNNLSKDEKRNAEEPEKPEPKLLIFQNDGTPEAKLKSLEDNRNGGVIYYDEMRAELEKTNNDKGYKALKTSTFDGDRFHKRLVNGGSIILESPVLCENGLITEQWLIDVLHKDDIASGFMARYLFSYNKKEDFQPLELKDIKLNAEKYAAAGKYIIELFGIDAEETVTFVLELEARQYYTNWFNDLSKTIYNTETNEEMTASLRLTTYVLKFALISYIFNSAFKKVDILKSGSLAVPLVYIKEAIYIMEIFRNENDKVLELFSNHNKLHKKVDSLTIKIQNKINSMENKKISRTNLLTSIRGLTASKLNDLIENNIFKVELIERKKYICE